MLGMVMLIVPSRSKGVSVFTLFTAQFVLMI